MTTRIKGDGMVDLIRGITPTLFDWDTDPTDAANIVDGDPNTICHEGTVNIAAYGAAGFEWLFDRSYQVITGGIGKTVVSAGTPRMYVWFKTNDTWRTPNEMVHYGTTDSGLLSMGGIANGVRLRLVGTAEATMTPYIRNFHVWRV